MTGVQTCALPIYDSYSYGRAGGRVSLFDNYYEWDGAGSSFAGVDKRYHAGNDTLIMRDLSREQVVMRLSGDDLEIGIKEEGKAFSGLSDVLTIKKLAEPQQPHQEPEYYERAIIEKFLSRCYDGLFYQLSAILYRFADDGSEDAKEALHSKYDYFASKKGRLK